MRRFVLIIFALLLGLIPLKAQDFSLADILIQSASAENADLTILLFALGQADADLLLQLNDLNADLTILAPSDAAFVEFMATNNLSMSDLVANPLMLNAIARYHILGESMGSAEISASENLLSLYADNTIAVSMQRDSIRLNENSQIVRDGFVANNGILHLIDQVLVPPSVQNMLLNRAGNEETRTIAEILQSREELSSLALALEENGLLETFSDTNVNFTLFAPTNAAFETAGLDGLTGERLLYHAFDNSFLAESLLTESSLTTLQGTDLQISYQAGNLVLNEQALVTEFDIQASNGVIHLINQILEIP